MCRHRTDAGDLVGADGHPQPGAADEQRPVRLAPRRPCEPPRRRCAGMAVFSSAPTPTSITSATRSSRIRSCLSTFLYSSPASSDPTTIRHLQPCHSSCAALRPIARVGQWLPGSPCGLQHVARRPGHRGRRRPPRHRVSRRCARRGAVPVRSAASGPRSPPRPRPRPRRPRLQDADRPSPEVTALPSTSTNGTKASSMVLSPTFALSQTLHGLHAGTYGAGHVVVGGPRPVVSQPLPHGTECGAPEDPGRPAGSSRPTPPLRRCRTDPAPAPRLAACPAASTRGSDALDHPAAVVTVAGHGVDAAQLLLRIAAGSPPSPPAPPRWCARTAASRATRRCRCPSSVWCETARRRRPASPAGRPGPCGRPGCRRGRATTAPARRRGTPASGNSPPCPGW